MPDPVERRSLPDLSERRAFHYRKNAYGGWEVVDESGHRAPRPHSFNQATKAAERSEALNAESARAFDEIHGSLRVEASGCSHVGHPDDIGCPDCEAPS